MAEADAHRRRTARARALASAGRPSRRPPRGQIRSLCKRWRRGESNPRPKAFRLSFYVRSRCVDSRARTAIDNLPCPLLRTSSCLASRGERFGQPNRLRLPESFGGLFLQTAIDGFLGRESVRVVVRVCTSHGLLEVVGPPARHRRRTTPPSKPERPHSTKPSRAEHRAGSTTPWALAPGDARIHRPRRRSEFSV